MFRKVINIITTVLLVLLIILVIFVFICRITGNAPSIFGYHVFRVQTDSMMPTLNVGDVIIVKSTPAEEIEVGDIITYRVISGSLEGQTITHRVVQEPELREGMYYFRTKGDREGAVEDEEVPYDRVEGKYLRTVPVFDKVYTFFLSPAGLITFIAVIMVLFGYEMISLIVSYKSVSVHDDDYYEPKPKKPSKKRRKK